MVKQKSNKFNIWSIKPDESLQPKKGWINMELRWLIDENTVGSEFGTLGYTVFPPGSQHAPHIHKNAEEYIMVTKGQGIASSGKTEYEVSAGDIIFIPKGDVHFTKNTSKKENLEIFFVYAGAPSLKKAGYKLKSSE